MAVNRRPRPGARLPVGVGWALTLAFDCVATTLTSLALCAVGLLLPGITEDYGPATGPTSPTALAVFACALALIATLAVTATLLARPGADRARGIALWLSAGRLALLVGATATFVAYGILTVEP
ncbi:hypothetical protein BCL76_114138 [Streptomyces sp. CG 926]|uniref:hypothetical protein n=1 Tax=Streptomyces sp. CG 926 TaxID=1882405 RepID=UPI000D6B150C|nr:hypothetical protein [Streptomyces sp. CG 926]PWK64816.1 hypothetical protein BCL76_114138 [Streptomyces sp. CG 926]